MYVQYVQQYPGTSFPLHPHNTHYAPPNMLHASNPSHSQNNTYYHSSSGSSAYSQGADSFAGHNTAQYQSHEYVPAVDPATIHSYTDRSN
jgi:hypothetical protein